MLLNRIRRQQCSPSARTEGSRARYTFGVCPVRVEVGKGSLVADLLESLGRLMVDLEDTARSPPPGAGACVTLGHVEIYASPSRRFCACVVGNGALEQDWRRQLGGIDG